MSNVIDNEIIDIIRARKIDIRLIESQQLSREKERDEILQQLIPQERDDKEKGEKIAVLRQITEGKLRDAEAAAAAARRELCVIASESSMIGHRATILRGKLRLLADPRIEASISALNDLAGVVRSHFKGHTIAARKNLMGDKSMIDVSNSTELSDALEKINATIQRFAALYEQPRPADLTAVIEENIELCRKAARKVSQTAVI